MPPAWVPVLLPAPGAAALLKAAFFVRVSVVGGGSLGGSQAEAIPGSSESGSATNRMAALLTSCPVVATALRLEGQSKNGSICERHEFGDRCILVVSSAGDLVQL